MIKQGTRKALKHRGTVLLVQKESGFYDDSGNYTLYLVGGDLLMLTGRSCGGRLDAINIADGRPVSLWRDWIVRNTSLAYDVRVLERKQDA